MPSRPSSLSLESVSLATADRVRASASSNANPRFFTVQQVADLLEVSTKTVRRWINRKLLIAHRMHGVLRISEADLRAFLSAHRDH